MTCKQQSALGKKINKFDSVCKEILCLIKPNNLDGGKKTNQLSGMQVLFSKLQYAWKLVWIFPVLCRYFLSLYTLFFKTIKISVPFLCKGDFWSVAHWVQKRFEGIQIPNVISRPKPQGTSVLINAGDHCFILSTVQFSTGAYLN